MQYCYLFHNTMSNINTNKEASDKASKHDSTYPLAQVCKEVGGELGPTPRRLKLHLATLRFHEEVHDLCVRLRQYPGLHSPRLPRHALP